MRPLKSFVPSKVSSLSARAGVLAVALALTAAIGAGTSAFAQTTPAEHHRAHAPGGEGMEILKLRGRLNLSTEQSAACASSACNAAPTTARKRPTRANGTAPSP